MRATIAAALSILGVRGLVGYDLAEGAYFHRELPFDLSRVETLQPRLRDARKLLERDGVQVLKHEDDRIEAVVAGSGVEHRVRLTAADARCTCPWFAKHQGQRGPCKHVLAVQLLLDRNEEALKRMALTAESLEVVLASGDEKACLALFAGATELERQAVAALACRWLKEQFAEPWVQTGPGTSIRNPRLTVAEAAVLASCSLGQLKKLGWRAIPSAELACQVLASRRPSWLADWARMVLEIHPRYMPIVRHLVREGLCRAPGHRQLQARLARFSQHDAGLP